MSRYFGIVLKSHNCISALVDDSVAPTTLLEISLLEGLVRQRQRLWRSYQRGVQVQLLTIKSGKQLGRWPSTVVR